MVHEDKLSAVLADFARTMITDFPIQQILDRLVHRIVQILPVSAAGVTLVSDSRTPRYVAASDEAAMRFERLQAQCGEGPCLSAYDDGVAVAVPDLREDHRFPRFAATALEAGLVAVFTFPLRHGEGRLGALDLYRETPGPLSDADLTAAQTLADVVAAYLINADARAAALAASDSFRHGALHDPLTGLANRRLLAQRLSHAALRAKRSHTSAGILFVDLDDFKAVNDAHGHRVGDEVLIGVARRLSALLRPGDTLVRFAGDEFVLLCEDLHEAADIEALANRIAGCFAEPLAVTGATVAMSASVGVAFAGPGVEITDDLVARADRAMYQAKRDADGPQAPVVDLRGQVRDDDEVPHPGGR